MFSYFYLIHDCYDHSKEMDGKVIATDMEDAIEKILSICPKGWHYYHICKES